VNLIDCATLACEKVGLVDAASILLSKKYARQRYKMIYDSALWQDTQILYATTTPAATPTDLIFPHYVERIVAVRYDTSGYNVPMSQASTLFLVAPSIFDDDGEPYRYIELPPVGVAVLPAAAGVLKFVSDDASDTGSVRVQGENGATEYRETVSLNGLTVVPTTRNYETPIIIAKDTTAGTITVKDASDNVIQTLPPDEKDRRHCRIRLVPGPTSSKAILVLCKRKPQPLIDDLDTPTLRGIDNTWLAYVTADMLETDKQYPKGQIKITEGAGLLAGVRDEENNQGQKESVIIPAYNGEMSRSDLYGGDDDCGWPYGKN